MWSRLAAERRARAIARLALLLHLEAEGDVVVDLHVREDGVALEDHRDPAAARRQVGRVAAADPDAPAVDLLEPGEAAEQRRLAAAGGPEEDDELAVGDLEVDVVDGGRPCRTSCGPLEADVSHLLDHPPPHVEEVLADDEDHEQRRREQEEPAGELERQRRLVQHREDLRGQRPLAQREDRGREHLVPGDDEDEDRRGREAGEREGQRDPRTAERRLQPSVIAASSSSTEMPAKTLDVTSTANGSASAVWANATPRTVSSIPQRR